MSRTEAQNRATYKYAKDHLKRVPLDLQLDEYAKVKAAADLSGESVNGFIKQAIRARLQAIDPASVQASPAGDIDGVTIGGVSPASTEK